MRTLGGVASLQVTPDDLEGTAVLLVFVDPTEPLAMDGLTRLQDVTEHAGKVFSFHLCIPFRMSIALLDAEGLPINSKVSGAIQAGQCQVCSAESECPQTLQFHLA